MGYSEAGKSFLRAFRKQSFRCDALYILGRNVVCSASEDQN